MYSRNEIGQFANVCTKIGNDVVDEFGFVSIRNLLSQFQANLLIRPLLVEGMLASVNDSQGNTQKSKWAILLDSETYSINESDIEVESSYKPLPSRLRNTVAHELVHSLAFRPAEFGIRLTKNIDSKKSKATLVKAIEDQTERLSPLLLWPEKSLTKFLSTKNKQLSAEELTQILRGMGISRYVLINRLSLLPLTDNNRNRAGLFNLGVGLGEWCDGNKAVLRKWPIFLNFDRNIVPSFLLTLQKQDLLAAEAIFPDRAFGMCGGPNNSIEFETNAGTISSANSTTMRVHCSIEETSRKPGSTFLVVVRKLSTA